MALGMHQAVALRDHARIDELAAEGWHPLNIIEHVIEMRGDFIDVLMSHVSRECSRNVFTVNRVVRHLEAWGRYDHALDVLRNWLNQKGTPNNR